MFDASIDSNTLEVHGKKLSGWKFRLDEIAAGDANYKEYQLQYWAPGATDWENDTRTTIEIPKLQVLKSVRLCVAVPDSSAMGGYKVATVKIGSKTYEVYRDDPHITEAIWQQAAADAEAQGGGVFLRIEWDNDDTPPATDITFINVGEIITIDIEPLRKRLDSLEARGIVWDSSINTLEGRARVVDVSVNKLETSVYTYLPPVINNINSSISSLKANDTSIINYINNDLSVYIHSEIDEVSAYIINTVIGEGGTGLTKRINDLDSSVGRLNSSVNNLETSVYSYLPLVINSINSSISALKDNDASIINYINTELAAQIDVIDSSIERINSSVSELESSVYSYLPPVLSSLRSDIDNVGTVIDERVNPRLEAVEEIVSTVDGSIKELYANNIEIIGAWAAAWNALFDANPTLRKPVSPVDPSPEYQDLTDAEFSYSSPSAIATEQGILQGAPTLTNTHNLAVTYYSSNTAVARVAADGVVTIMANAGSATIKAIFSGDSTYNPKEVSYNLSVLAPDPTVDYYIFAKNYQLSDNPEYISVIVDDADHVLYGKKTDGTVYNSNLVDETMTEGGVTQSVPIICAALKDVTQSDLDAHNIPNVTPTIDPSTADTSTGD